MLRCSAPTAFGPCERVLLARRTSDQNEMMQDTKGSRYSNRYHWHITRSFALSATVRHFICAYSLRSQLQNCRWIERRSSSLPLFSLAFVQLFVRARTLSVCSVCEVRLNSCYLCRLAYSRSGTNENTKGSFSALNRSEIDANISSSDLTTCSPYMENRRWLQVLSSQRAESSSFTIFVRLNLSQLVNLWLFNRFRLFNEKMINATAQIPTIHGND